MKSAFYSLLSISLWAITPVLASAQEGILAGDESAGELGETMNTIISFIQGYVLPFMLGLAFIFFVWGVFKYFILGGADEDKRSEGKNLIIYAIAAFVIILVFFGLVNLFAGAIGGEDATIDLPTVPGAGAD